MLISLFLTALLLVPYVILLTVGELKSAFSFLSTELLKWHFVRRCSSCILLWRQRHKVSVNNTVMMLKHRQQSQNNDNSSNMSK